MTLKELSQLYYLNREIEIDQRRLDELRVKAESPSTPQLSNMPKNTGVENKLERYVAEIVDLAAIISAKQQQCIHEQNRLERYIADIDDSLTRQIFTLRFVNGFDWRQTIKHLGKGFTVDCIRQRVYRHLKKAT